LPISQQQESGALHKNEGVGMNIEKKFEKSGKCYISNSNKEFSDEITRDERRNR
jgi:hypothetical protein